MKFKRFVALFMCVLMVGVFSGCSNSKGREFLKIGDKSYYENEMYYNIYNLLGYSLYGVIQFDEAADIETIKKEIDNLYQNEEYKDFIDMQKIAFLKQKVCDNQLLKYANENNITLTDEEKAQADEMYKSYEEFFSSKDTVNKIAEEKFSDSSNAQKEAKDYLKKYKTAFLGTYGVTNFKDLKGVLYDLTLINKVIQAKKDEVPDDEEYVKKYYDELVAAQKQAYDADVSAFETDYNYGETIVYYPAGLRYVKHILIKFNEEELGKLNEYETTISELQAKENPTDEEKKQLSDTQKLYNDLKAKVENDAKTKADSVYSKLSSGQDFDALLKEYGQDAGMTEENSNYDPNGYLVSSKSNMVEEFLSVAMSLKKVGDYSKPVKSEYGYHIIKYTKQVENKAVDYNSIHDTILTEAMEEKKNEVALEFYDSVYDKAIDSAVINYEVLGMDKERFDSLYNKIMAEI